MNFEVLLDMGDDLTQVLVSGIRADDMALRLYYTGIPAEKIRVIHDYDKLIDKQLERATVSATAGFAKIFADSAKKMTYVTA